MVSDHDALDDAWRKFVLRVRRKARARDAASPQLDLFLRHPSQAQVKRDDEQGQNMENENGHPKSR